MTCLVIYIIYFNHFAILFISNQKMFFCFIWLLFYLTIHVCLSCVKISIQNTLVSRYDKLHDTLWNAPLVELHEFSCCKPSRILHSDSNYAGKYHVKTIYPIQGWFPLNHQCRTVLTLKYPTIQILHQLWTWREFQQNKSGCILMRFYTVDLVPSMPNQSMSAVHLGSIGWGGGDSEDST